MTMLLPPARRSFVSTVLLSRTWESHTVVELRNEAKTRGLSTKGNKATLIARIKEHEHIAAPRTTRNLVLPKTSSQATSPGIPEAAQAATDPEFLAVKLPNVSQQPPSVPVQAPYVPDFWNSARSKTDPPVEPVRPRLLVVGGSATHFDGGPTHNLEKPQEDSSLSTFPSTSLEHNDLPVSRDAGFWAEFWDSLGLPRSFSARRSLSEARHSAAEAGRDGTQRPLTNGERRGVYILLGMLGGSWIVGGLVNRRTEEHDAETEH